MRSVECCGVAQMSEYEVLIFGGLQKGSQDEEEASQLLVFNTESHSFMGLQSFMKFLDYFQLQPYMHFARPTPVDGEGEERKIGERQEATLYAWSIYGALHSLDMQTF